MASSSQHPGPPRPRPVLITEAEPSLTAQHAARKKRYAITMGVRAASVVLATALINVVPFWVVLTLMALGTFLPGFAVVMANDRPPKKRVKVSGYAAPPDRVLESPAPVRVIDG